MPVFKDHSFRFGASANQGEDVYEVEKSIRFNDDDTAYMSRTFTASNRRTLTFSCWVKRSNLSTNQNIFGPQTSNSGSGTYGVIRFNPQNELDIFDYTNGVTNWRLQSTQLLMDPSAWYHLVFSMDTTNAISAERLRMYINGQRITNFDVETYPSLNYEGQWNNNLSHEIGAIQRGSSNQYLDGYLAEIYFLDGYAYGPEYFGEFNSSNIWIPKEYDGSYGTNGFSIKGEDSSDLGNDSSGNNNDFTTSGLAAHDQMPDSPTNNWCVLSTVNKTPSIGIFNGGLGHNYYSNQYNDGGSGTLMVPNSGKWYWEQIVIAANIYGGYAGFKTQNVTNRKHTPTNVPNSGGSTVGRWGNRIFKDGPSVELLGGTPTTNEVTGIMIDLDNYTVQFYEDGSTIGSAVSIASTYSGWLPFISTNTVGSEQGVAPLQTGYTANFVARVNFGQDSTFGGQLAGNTHTDANGLGNFKKQPPTGALAICTRNIITGLV